MSGYSKTPLAKKLGYKAGFKVLLVNAPDAYAEWVEPLPEVEFADHPPYDLVHIFANEKAILAAELEKCRHEIRQNGMIWVSWYKRSSGMQSEVTEDTIREVAFPLGLVDIKVCSVSEDWSGLKVVIRKELRT